MDGEVPEGGGWRRYARVVEGLGARGWWMEGVTRWWWIKGGGVVEGVGARGWLMEGVLEGIGWRGYLRVVHREGSRGW